MFFHLTWFVRPEVVSAEPSRTFFQLPPPDQAILVGMVLSILLLIVAASVIGKRIPLISRVAHRLESFANFFPHVLRTLVGVALVGHTINQALFAPDLPLVSAGAFGPFLSIAQFTIGLGLALGFFVHIFAIALMILYGLVLFLFPWMTVLHYIGFFGIGLALALVGKATSLERWKGRPVKETNSITILRTVTGIELILLGFMEKLLDGRLGIDFLHRNPINIFQTISPWMTDERFVYLAGLVEVGLGLLLVLKWAPRATALILASLLFTTLFLFGPLELFGHLTFFGVGFALFTFGHCPVPPPHRTMHTKAS